MLGLKFIGGGVLLWICLGYCLQSVKEARFVHQRLEAWIALLTFVRGQIACFGRPLSDILLAADRGVLEKLDIEPSREQMLSEYCRADATLLRAAGGSVLGTLAEELGTVWRKEQVERLDYHIAALEDACRAYTAKLSERLRARCTIVLCGGAGILLLVW